MPAKTCEANPIISRNFRYKQALLREAFFL
jgi:hypothetical protein